MSVISDFSDGLSTTIGYVGPAAETFLDHLYATSVDINGNSASSLGGRAGTLIFGPMSFGFDMVVRGLDGYTVVDGISQVAGLVGGILGGAGGAAVTGGNPIAGYTGAVAGAQAFSTVAVDIYDGEYEYHIRGHGITEYHEQIAEERGVAIEDVMDPRGTGGNWGFNSPEHDPNHVQLIEDDGEILAIEADGTRLEETDEHFVSTTRNGDGSITVVTETHHTGVLTGTTFVETASGTYTPISVIDMNVSSGGYSADGNVWGNDWNDPRTGVVRDPISHNPDYVSPIKIAA